MRRRKITYVVVLVSLAERVSTCAKWSPHSIPSLGLGHNVSGSRLLKQILTPNQPHCIPPGQKSACHPIHADLIPSESHSEGYLLLWIPNFLSRPGPTSFPGALLELSLRGADRGGGRCGCGFLRLRYWSRLF